MARKCTICSHKDRNKIDSAIAVDGASFRNIAVQFRVSVSSLKRHMDNGHISEKCLTAKRIQEVHEIETFQSKHQRISDDLWDQKQVAHDAGDFERELKVTREIIRLHDIDGKASGVYREKVEHSGEMSAAVRMVSGMSDEEVIARAKRAISKRE